MAHPFPAKIEVIPKRRRKSPIGAIKPVNDGLVDDTWEITTTRDVGINARESRLINGYDLFQSLQSRNLKRDMYATDIRVDDIEFTSDSDVDTNDLTPIDPSRNRNNFLGFKQFRVLELIRQLRTVSRSASPNAFNDYDVSSSSSSDEESSHGEDCTKLSVPDSPQVAKRKNVTKPQAKSIKPVPKPVPQSSTPRVTNNSRRAIVTDHKESIIQDYDFPNVVVDEVVADDKTISKSKQSNRNESQAKVKATDRPSKSKAIKSEVKEIAELNDQVDHVGDEPEPKNKKNFDKKLNKRNGNKIEKVVCGGKESKMSNESSGSKEIVEVKTKNVNKNMKSIDAKKVRNDLGKKLYKRAIENVVKKSQKKVDKKKKMDKPNNERIKKAEKVTEKKVDKNVAVAKGLAALKNIWKERLSKLKESEAKNSGAQHNSPALSSCVITVSEHSSINSPRTPSILREARLQVDTSKLSPLVLKPREPSCSPSESSSSSGSSETEEDEPVEVKKKVVQKKSPSKRRKPLPGRAKSPSKKRPGEINCVICGAIKFYSHKQRRFGQYSCESCSKFFYYFLKTPNGLFCDNDGDCIIGANTPVQSRCRACWLKLCLQTYTIPDEQRSNLSKNNFLPKLSSAPHVSLISVDTVNVNNHVDIVPKRVVDVNSESVEKKNRLKPIPGVDDKKEDGLLMMVSTMPTIKVITQQSSPSISSPGSVFSPQQASPAPKSLKDIRVKRGKVVFAPKESPVTPNIATTQAIQAVSEVCTTKETTPLKQTKQSRSVPNPPKSQVPNVSQARGPRVKNVCRTSLTGLPVATFGSIGDEDDERDDLGTPEENVDSDDSDNIPLCDYIWKVIAEDQAAKAGVNGEQEESNPAKPTKKSKAKFETCNDVEKKSNGTKKKTKEVTEKVALNGKTKSVKKSTKPRMEKIAKVTFAPKKVPSKKKSQNDTTISKTVDAAEKLLPIVEKAASPFPSNINSDTDIEEEEVKPVHILKPKKAVKRKVLSPEKEEKSENCGLQSVETKVKKTKKPKISFEEKPAEEKKVEPLVINTTVGFCSCPVPVLKTPPDQVVDITNGSAVVVTPVDIESPVKKKGKKKALKERRQSTDVESSPSKDSSQSPSPKKKGDRTSSSDRARARKRCNECTGCKAVDCGSCAPCKDKKKFGGPNIRKQACKMRRCLSLFNCGTMSLPTQASSQSEEDKDQETIEKQLSAEPNEVSVYPTLLEESTINTIEQAIEASITQNQ